jgi:hypothetical protein
MKPLRWILQFALGCRHRHLSRVFTIKHRSYRVCFDCAREFDLPDAHGPARSDVSPGAHLGTNFTMHDEALALIPPLP